MNMPPEYRLSVRQNEDCLILKSTSSPEKTPLSDVALLNVDTAEGTMSSRGPFTAMIDLEGVKSRQRSTRYN